MEHNQSAVDYQFLLTDVHNLHFQTHFTVGLNTAEKKAVLLTTERKQRKDGSLKYAERDVAQYFNDFAMNRRCQRVKNEEKEIVFEEVS
ncbi:hypothetical protein CDAR_305451 [Caerostris darwini]|uniref:Uncharacterized protein n=1 Tax=Caerostris darwini TaxID=1538125 RepID=A0AAV4MFL8_9ARAC|nr:hypothetical protein CDAR_305451 [Caerostris darwini]